MKVRELMSQPVTAVRTDTTLEEIARIMLTQHIGCVPVVDAQGKLRGIITESDFTAKEKGVPFSTFRAPQLFGQWVDQGTIERLYETARTMRASEIMSAHTVTVTEEQPVETAIQLLLKHDVNRLPVVRDGVPVGIVSRHDLLRLMVRKMAGEELP